MNYWNFCFIASSLFSHQWINAKIRGLKKRENKGIILNNIILNILFIIHILFIINILLYY